MASERKTKSKKRSSSAKKKVPKPSKKLSPPMDESWQEPWSGEDATSFAFIGGIRMPGERSKQ